MPVFVVECWLEVWVVDDVLHSTLALVRGGDFPGVVTAPALLAAAAFLIARLREDERAAREAPAG